MLNLFDEIVIYTDGGSRGNPGIAACAFVVEEGGNIVYRRSLFLGNSTNNVAEYRGVAEAYKWLLKNRKSAKRFVFKMDSELVSKQLNGDYSVRKKELLFWWKEIKRMEGEFGGEVSYIYIPRSENKEADRLLNFVLDRVSRLGGNNTT